MPKGYTNICIRKDRYKHLKTLAKAHKRSVANFIEYLLTLLPDPDGEKA